MAKAIEAGIPQMRIEEAATRKQARIDTGKDILVGVNRFRTEANQDFEIREVDNTEVRNNQVQRIQALKAQRNEEQVQHSLQQLKQAASDSNQNLLALAIEAARHRATLGEISQAMEQVFGRYIPSGKGITGVYLKETMEHEQVRKAQQVIQEFEQWEGRRPRILVAKMGQDGHDRGAKIIATSFADLGFDVDIGPLFQLPSEVALQATESDVHFVGVSSLAAGHKTLVPQLIAELAKLDRADIRVIVGGVIPRQDYDFLYEAGVMGIFGPGTVIAEAAVEILQKFMGKAA